MPERVSVRGANGGPKMGAFGPLPYGGRLTMPSVPHKKASDLTYVHGKERRIGRGVERQLGTY